MQRQNLPRVDVAKQAPAVYQTMLALGGRVRALAEQVALDPLLQELVNIRVSQINGCAFCLDTHHRDARDGGEDSRRLALLATWRETDDWFTARERAALELAENVTLISRGNVPDELYARCASVLNEDEIAAVTWLAITMNTFNRIAIASRYRIYASTDRALRSSPAKPDPRTREP